MRVVRWSAPVVIALTLAGAAHAQSPARLSVGPLFGFAPGIALDGRHVPTVGIAVDARLLRVRSVGLHVAGSAEYRAGARMTGLVASASVPFGRGLTLRAGWGGGAADVQRFWYGERASRAWNGLDAGIEWRLGRTTSGITLRRATIRGMEPRATCAPSAGCDAPELPTTDTPFTRVVVQSRYAIF